MKLKTILKSFFFFIPKHIYIYICRIGICEGYIVVNIDGGLCSQMHQYIIGQMLKERGLNVKYTLLWFKKNGYDMDHVFKMDYELPIIFPQLKIELIKNFCSYFYKSCFFSSDEEQTLRYDYTAPIFLGGYYTKFDIVKYMSLFHVFFNKDLLVSYGTPLYLEIKNEKSCAVHVRRGDLANRNLPFYGTVNEDYFVRAIDYVLSKTPNIKFYFFSQDIDWVRCNICDKYDSLNYYLVDGNKGYEDFLLITACDSIIASQGSFGKYACFVKNYGLLILNNSPQEKKWSEYYNNIVYL